MNEREPYANGGIVRPPGIAINVSGDPEKIRLFRDVVEGILVLTGRFADEFTASLGAWPLDPELPAAPDTRTPQQRALPRPTTTPPMWAQDPTKTRRRR